MCPLGRSSGWPTKSARSSSRRTIAAAKNGDQAAALALVAQKSGINDATTDGTTALHWAVQSADRKLVTAPLEAGAHANAAKRYEA